ncbi:phage minor head protein [Streptococcus uberis]|uniref:phage minor head protein n=1 Tax=Streptococcus uberis TaxID=1349 RepID=UPI0015F163DA|nr:phage minor head protein [Streptococcus uberis]
MSELNKFQQEIEDLLKQSDKITDQRLFNLYVEEIKSLRKALQIDFNSFDDLTSTQKLKLSQMTALLEQLDISAAKLKKSLGSTINSHLMDTGQIAYNELFYEFESGNGGVNFALLRDDELRTLIETPVANFKLSERINDGLVPDLQKNIKNELTRLFLNGESMGKVSSRLAEVGYSSYRRAMMITRTEAGRVQAITRQKAQLEAERLDIQFEKQWVATLDKRTRHNHALLDGVRVNPDGYFEINGHKTKQPHMFGIASEDINCRCRTISVLLDDTEPMLRRDNETGEVVEYKNYRDWESNRVVPEKPEPESEEPKFHYIKPEEIPYFKEKAGKISDRNRSIIYAQEIGGMGYIATPESFYINEGLRMNLAINEMPSSHQKIIKSLDQVLRANKSPNDIKVNRFDDESYFVSVIENNAELLKKYNSVPDMLNSGEATFSNAGYTSTSYIPKYNFFKHRSIKTIINIPKNSKIYITDNDDESEIILPRNSKYDIISMKENKGGVVIEMNLREE